MKKLNEQSGFTLIEIIVVLIIIGVLAAIALPNLFSNVARSKSAEGISNLGPFKSQVEGCIMGHPNSEHAECSSISASLVSTANFTYQFQTSLVDADTSGGNYVLEAVSNTVPGNSIYLSKNTATGQMTCSGNGTFVGVC